MLYNDVDTVYADSIYSGKLLKCIDDLKDSGRLDEGRVKEGRAVLAATLSSHGLHTEERICRVVEAVEYDRGQSVQIYR